VEAKHDSVCYDVTRNYKCSFLCSFFFGGVGWGGVLPVNGTRCSNILRKWPTLQFTQAGILEVVNFQQSGNFSYVELTARYYVTISITKI
jgi:hypothetical protein